jgi:hypothetical protein
MFASGGLMAETSKILDEAEREIDAFDEWFRAQGAERLVRSERAILKTFWVARTSGKYPVPAIEGRASEGGPFLSPCQLT